jgi:hypothetical protein
MASFWWMKNFYRMMADELQQLTIPSDANFAGPDRIFLANKRVLLPRSRFDELRKFVDWLEGKASAPR